MPVADGALSSCVTAPPATSHRSAVAQAESMNRLPWILSKPGLWSAGGDA